MGRKSWLLKWTHVYAVDWGICGWEQNGYTLKLFVLISILLFEYVLEIFQSGSRLYKCILSHTTDWSLAQKLIFFCAGNTMRFWGQEVGAPKIIMNIWQALGSQQYWLVAECQSEAIRCQRGSHQEVIYQGSEENWTQQNTGQRWCCNEVKSRSSAAHWSSIERWITTAHLFKKKRLRNGGWTRLMTWELVAEQWPYQG